MLGADKQTGKLPCGETRDMKKVAFAELAACRQLSGMIYFAVITIPWIVEFGTTTGNETVKEIHTSQIRCAGALPLITQQKAVAQKIIR